MIGGLKMNEFRPTNLKDIIGQEKAKRLISVIVEASKKNQTSPGHTLILGPAGIGKSTVANSIADALNVKLISVMATKINNWYDMVDILKTLGQNDILFIDEIHALKPKVQEFLYDVLEDFQYDNEVFVDYGKKEMVKQQLPHFTAIGATTHVGNLTLPLRRRFPIIIELVPYTAEELATIIKKSAMRVYGINGFPDDVAKKMGNLSKANASVAVNMLNNLMQVITANTVGTIGASNITVGVVETLADLHSIDPIVGLDRSSRSYLVTLANENRPVGVSGIAALINEQEDTVKVMVEPFLLSYLNISSTVDNRIYSIHGPLAKMTRSGREITPMGLQYLEYCSELQEKGWLVGERLKVSR